MTILALDPGKDKCGVAIVLWENGESRILQRMIVAAAQLEQIIPEIATRHGAEKIIIGDATTSKTWSERLRMLLPGLPLETVSETGSTLEARPLYWQANPPRGWRRFVPLSLQAPPEPVDDFAAVVLARRYFAKR